jgi:hypothetical protein
LIDQGIITPGFIVDSLPPEYKLKEETSEPKPNRRTQRPRFTFHNPSYDLPNCFTALLGELSGYTDTNKAESIPPQRLMQESRDWQLRMIKTWSDDSIYIASRILIPLAPLLMAFAERMQEEAKTRRSKGKLLSP